MSIIRLSASCRAMLQTLSALLILIAAVGCGSAPLLGSEEVSSTADALYTAVTSRRLELVDAVEENLKRLQAE